MPNVVAVVQARMGSTRLPGKILEDIAGQSALAHVLSRVSAVPGVSAVCCAVPETTDSDPVAAEAERLGTRVFRGDEQNVLGRYVGAARQCAADVVMRITSDCPLIDPAVSGRVLSHFLETKADYCSNLDPRSWPKGLDTEVFSAAILETAACEASEKPDLEHVTPWIRRNASLKHASVVNAHGDFAAYRWTLDYPEDLAFFRALYKFLPQPPAVPTFDDVLAVVHAHPDVAKLNA
ncbi:MAG: glycosyltransferase family protein, partial [Rhodospirillaceae bacterium]